MPFFESGFNRLSKSMLNLVPDTRLLQVSGNFAAELCGLAVLDGSSDIWPELLFDNKLIGSGLSAGLASRPELGMICDCTAFDDFRWLENKSSFMVVVVAPPPPPPPRLSDDMSSSILADDDDITVAEAAGVLTTLVTLEGTVVVVVVPIDNKSNSSMGVEFLFFLSKVCCWLATVC